MNENSIFISKLVRYANSFDSLSEDAKSALICRAVDAITEMRAQAGIPASNTTADAINKLKVAESDDDMKAALLLAASMIRDLHIVLDSNTEIFIGRAPD